jgi:DNA-binding GntR family transcriptional regulator
MKNTDLKSRVYDTLRSSILNFRLLPGVKLSDKQISQEMGISRTPVREALVRLSEQGLVESHPNRGFTVKSFTVSEIDHLYTLREALEVLAVRQAIPNLDKKKVKALRELTDRFISLAKSNNLVGMIHSDEEFHDLISTYSENPPLIHFLRSLHDQIRIARRYDHLHADKPQKTYEAHLQIVDFMAQEETSKASRAMSHHILRSKKNVLSFLNASVAQEFG